MEQPDAKRQARLEYMRNWWAARSDEQREAERERGRRRAATRTEEYKAQQRESARHRWNAMTEEERAKTLADMRERARHRYNDTRKAVFDHYGRVCACCGTVERLSIDHVMGDGKQHRQELFGSQRGGVDFYRWLIDQGFPSGYQTLCRACNGSKRDGPGCRIHGERPAVKRCSKCGQVKELSDFNRRTRSATGRRSDCRACQRAQQAA